MNKKLHISSRVILCAALVVFTITLIVVFFSVIKRFDDVIFANNDILFTERVSEVHELQKGLGGRESLCARCGMVFILGDPGRHNFWMKNMHFDIDIIWSRDNTIVHIEKNVPHELPKKIYAPEVLSDTVLEVPAGRSDAYGFTVGGNLDIAQR